MFAPIFIISFIIFTGVAPTVNIQLLSIAIAQKMAMNIILIQQQ